MHYFEAVHYGYGLSLSSEPPCTCATSSMDDSSERREKIKQLETSMKLSTVV